MRLYSTLARGLVDLPEPPGPIGMYVCGPTVYARAHIGNARPYVLAAGTSAGCASAATTSRSSTTSPTSTTRSTRPPRVPVPSARAEATEWYLEDIGRFGLDEVDHWPQGDRVDGRDRRVHRRPDRARLRLRGRRRRLLPRRALGGVRPALGAEAGSGRGAGAESAQGGSARLRALEGEQARGGHVRGTRRGDGGGRAGTSSARRWPRSCSGPSSRSTAAGSTSSSPTTRTSWRSRGPSATSSRRSGCTTACSASPARRCRSRSGTSRRSRRCSTGGARETTLLFFLTAHWRSPIDFSDERMADAQARGTRVSRGVPEPVRDRPRPDAWERFSGGARRRLLTPAALALHARVAAVTNSDRRALDVFGLSGLAARGGRAVRDSRAGGRRARRHASEGLRRSDKLRDADRGRGLGGARRGRRLPPRPRA